MCVTVSWWELFEGSGLSGTDLLCRLCAKMLIGAAHVGTDARERPLPPDASISTRSIRSKRLRE